MSGDVNQRAEVLLPYPATEGGVAESGGPLKIEWHCFVSVSGFLTWPGWWNKGGFMCRQKPSVLSNEEQLRGLETAPRQRGQRAAEDRAAGLP